MWGGSRTTLMGGHRRNIAVASEWGGTHSTLRGGLNGHIEVRNACRRLNMRCTCSKGVLTCRAEIRVLECTACAFAYTPFGRARDSGRKPARGADALLQARANGWPHASIFGVDADQNP